MRKAVKLKAVKDIVKGDIFRSDWIALGDASRNFRGDVEVEVQFLSDGGLSTRVWDDPDHELTLHRGN